MTLAGLPLTCGECGEGNYRAGERFEADYVCLKCKHQLNTIDLDPDEGEVIFIDPESGLLVVADTPCEFRSQQHHSGDVVMVYAGSTEPYKFCGFHASDYFIKDAMAEAKRRREEEQ